MGLYENVKNAALKRGYSVNRLEKELGFARSSISKFNKNVPGTDKISTIADFLNVPVSELLGLNDSEKNEPALTSKDERDIEKIINHTRDQLLNQEGLMFDGDPASPEAIESILSAMQIGMEMAKKKNKEKYTPKKYKKD